ncbi:MAG: PEGA domain-containing protein [Muribaculum sp.]|nr:PEGA domain-containing protein [Muribaculaceae bacterium]MCM1080428.1 PEGA domain-containing protein [Muribaculum sp.]
MKPRKSSHYHTLRLIALFIIAVVASTSAIAQELRLTEATSAMEPMTVPMQRLDANNEICALVKVVLPKNDVLFEGNLVGDALFKTSEYWVYLTPGTKMLKVKAPGYYPLMINFPEIGLGALASKSIYYLTIKADGEQSQSEPQVAANYAIITVAPQNATVEIDGQLREIVDGAVTALLKPGRHTYEVKAPGYTTDSGTFDVISTAKTRLSVTLKSQKANLKITSMPDAEIFINGTKKATGNWTGELSPGLYNYELRRPGCRPISRTVELKSGDSLEFAESEFIQIFGSINVDYRPIGAQIKIDGKSYGESPANLTNLPVGNHKLTIESPGYATFTQSINITESTPLSISGSLAKASTETSDKPAANTPTTFSNDKIELVPTTKTEFDIVELIEKYPLGICELKRGSLHDITPEALQTVGAEVKKVSGYYFAPVKKYIRINNVACNSIECYLINDKLHMIVFSFCHDNSKKDANTLINALKRSGKYTNVNKKFVLEKNGSFTEAKKYLYNSQLNYFIAYDIDDRCSFITIHFPTR